MNLSATFPRTCHLPSQHFASTLPTNPSSPAHIFTETHAKHDFSHTISFPSSSIPVSDYIPPVRDLDTKPSPMLFRTTQPSPLLEDVGDNVAYGNINPKSPSIFSNATRGTFVTLPRSPTGKPLMYLPARRVTPRKVNNRSLASTQKRNTTHTPESRTPASSHSQRQNSGTPQGASPLSSRSAHVGIIIPPFPSDSDVQQSALTTPQTATHRKVQFADHPQQTKEPYQDLPPQPKTPPILSVLQEQEKAMKNIREDRRKTPQRERRRADREHDESSSDSASDWEQPNPYCMLIEEVVSVEPPSYYQRDTRTNRELREREKMRRFAGKQAEKEWDDEEGLERELDPDSELHSQHLSEHNTFTPQSQSQPKPPASPLSLPPPPPPPLHLRQSQSRTDTPRTANRSSNDRQTPRSSLGDNRSALTPNNDGRDGEITERMERSGMSERTTRTRNTRHSTIMARNMLILPSSARDPDESF